MIGQILHGDCLALMREMDAVSFAAVITDPPYGIRDKAMKDLPGRRGGDNTWHAPSEWDSSIDPEWCKEAARLAPLVVWFGHWRKRAEVEAAMPYPIRCEIVWAKDTHVGPPCPVAMQDERIWVFSADAVQTREFATSVWSIPIIPSWAYRHHKNEKPVALMAKAVRVFTDRGARILDPFAGSGTTGVAALSLGREFVGIEESAEHVATARKRLAETGFIPHPEIVQDSLFGDAA